MAEARFFGLLGLAARAGQLEAGDFACERVVRGGGAAMVLMDAGASANTRKKYADACVYHKVPLYIVEEGRLGHAIGKPGRMTVVVKPGTLSGKLARLLLAEPGIEHQS
ncbi:MAG: 50S ribosomal protein L7ae [Clostridia bacterium]